MILEIKIKIQYDESKDQNNGLTAEQVQAQLEEINSQAGDGALSMGEDLQPDYDILETSVTVIKENGIE